MAVTREIEKLGGRRSEPSMQIWNVTFCAVGNYGALAPARNRAPAAAADMGVNVDDDEEDGEEEEGVEDGTADGDAVPNGKRAEGIRTP
jgi:hypothetical protein